MSSISITPGGDDCDDVTQHQITVSPRSHGAGINVRTPATHRIGIRTDSPDDCDDCEESVSDAIAIHNMDPDAHPHLIEMIEASTDHNVDGGTFN